jgi:hypothetical protein
MKKTSIVGYVKEQHELICKGRVAGECRFAETENTREDTLRHADSNPDVRFAHHGSEAKSAFQGMVGHSSVLVQCWR